MNEFFQKYLYLTLLSVAWLACAGCQKGLQEERIPTFPVTGTLRINGKPAAGAMIKLYNPQGEGRMPTALVRADGSFSMSYYTSEDGAPTGKYQLLVLWMVPPPGGGLPHDQLQGEFANPSQPVRTVTILAGENQLGPINLKTNISTTN